MTKTWRVKWQVWNEETEEYEMRNATCVKHSTKESANRERIELLDDPRNAGESFFVMEVRE